uniref:Uncharacterized protein n=1 Tax=Anguilla anguilla TaxID=7936 RepID=A0A0E9URU1_ANGAN
MPPPLCNQEKVKPKENYAFWVIPYTFKSDLTFEILN